ncbi:MAG: M23 family metallopeptidase, partial [Clostridia bacterium]|nr:M23 family metallopeptidase [Clostridia bacterium]
RVAARPISAAQPGRWVAGRGPRAIATGPLGLPRWAWQSAAAAAVFLAVFSAGRAMPEAPWLRALERALGQDTIVDWARAVARLAPGGPLAGPDALPVGGPPAAGTPPVLPTGLGELRRPLDGEAASWFGFRQIGGKPQYHTGLDIAGRPGDPVRVVAAGTVASVGRSPDGAGIMVVVRHAGPWSTAYVHLSAANVRVGDTVKAGDILGPLGAFADPGSGATAALHFELRDDGHPVDPAPYLGLVPANGT